MRHWEIGCCFAGPLLLWSALYAGCSIGGLSIPRKDAKGFDKQVAPTYFSFYFAHFHPDGNHDCLFLFTFFYPL